MKASIYNNVKISLKNFTNEQEAIKYYEYILSNNPESSVYPKELREFHKGLIMGLKGSLELKKINKKDN